MARVGRCLGGTRTSLYKELLNSYLLLYNSTELATKEAETGKPHTNLTASNTVEHLLNESERQEKRGLCGLETEPVKLIKTQEGKLNKTSGTSVINLQKRDFVFGGVQIVFLLCVYFFVFLSIDVF